MEWLIIPITIIFGMIGGQRHKIIRRAGIPVASIIVSWKKKKWRSLLYALMFAVLSSGYGQNSKLYKLCGGRKWLVRLIYGLATGGVVALVGFVWALIIMPLAYMVRFPFSFKIGKYDFLWQDFYTYSLLGICIWRAIC